MEQSGLSHAEIEQIRGVFAQYPQIESVILYGSRAMGNFQPASDIDLSLVGEAIDFPMQARIEIDLEDLLLPYTFDITVYHKLKDPSFISHINRVGIPCYQRSANRLLK